MYSFIFILDVNFLRENDGPETSLILFLGYGPSLIFIAYLFSFLFKSGSKGQMFVFLITYLGSFSFSIASFVLRLVNSTRDAHDDVIVWIFRFFPFYDFTASFIHMGNIGLYTIFYKWDEMPKYLDTKIALIEIIFLFATFLILTLLLIWIENWIQFMGLFANNKSKSMDPEKAPKEIREDIKYLLSQNGFEQKKVRGARLTADHSETLQI